jgi:hypothetical protein
MALNIRALARPQASMEIAGAIYESLFGTRFPAVAA